MGPPPLNGAVALVTGASEGIGRATAHALAAAGADVAAVARREDKLIELAAAAAPGRVTPLAADLTELGAAESVIAGAVDIYGRLDILVNSAGLMMLGDVRAADAGDSASMVELNLLALMRTCTAALPHLLRAGKSGPRHVADVVNIGSLSGRFPTRGRSGYAATKAGVSAFTEALRQEVCEQGVRVALVEPGLTKTGLRSRNSREALRAMEQITPGLSGVEPLDPGRVADAVTFIVCQPADSSITQLVVRPTRQQS